MMTHAYLLAVLIGTSVGGAADALPEDRGLQISAIHALADIEQIGAVLATSEVGQVEAVIDIGGLKSQVVAKLAEGGVPPVDRETGHTPRLVVNIEGMAVPDCDKYVYRVQTSVDRLVTFSGRRNVLVQAQVWQVRPAMGVVERVDGREAIIGAVLTQAEAFLDAWNAARGLRDQAQVPPQGLLSPVKAGPQNLQTMAGYPFVASRNSPVFHRSDCRWARNISDDNRIGYESREQAVQAGKRPCKTCKP